MSLGIRSVIVLLFVLVIATVVFVRTQPLHIVSNNYHEQTTPHGPLLFTGDVMLARAVEDIMTERGYSHIFQFMTKVHASYGSVVSNFEGVIPETHMRTPDFSFAFSIKKEAVQAIKDAHITHLTLANNHSLDFDVAGLLSTRKALRDASLQVFGDPHTVSTTTVSFIDSGDVRIALVGIHAVWKEPSHTELAETFKQLRTDADIIIPVVHWGVEYTLVHSPAQEALARELISLGADVIIGHHPHVVQDIGMIDGVPVFYSLGNYIFDQYWNATVEEGMLVGISTIKDHTITYDLLPIRSSRSIPRRTEGEVTDAFLANLAKRSDPSIASDIARGTFSSHYTGR